MQMKSVATNIGGRGSHWEALSVNLPGYRCGRGWDPPTKDEEHWASGSLSDSLSVPPPACRRPR